MIAVKFNSKFIFSLTLPHRINQPISNIVNKLQGGLCALYCPDHFAEVKSLNCKAKK